MNQTYKRRIEKDREHHRKIMKKAIKRAVPTKKKMEISCITGSIIFVGGCLAYPFSKGLSLSLLAVGSIQVVVASIVKKKL